MKTKLLRKIRKRFDIYVEKNFIRTICGVKATHYECYDRKLDTWHTYHLEQMALKSCGFYIVDYLRNRALRKIHNKPYL